MVHFLGSVAVAAAILISSAASAATATVDPAGYLRVDGEPFFPIGIVHVSWIGDRQGEDAVPDLHLAADAGFNLIHPTVDARADMIDLLDAAAARGVRVIAETPWPQEDANAFVEKWKAHPSIIAWNIADDFNAPYAGPGYNHPPQQVSDRNDLIHTIAPGHATFASGGAFPGFRIDDFAGLVDIMAFQSYPLGAQNNPDEYALEENIDSFDWVRDQLDGTGQLWVANSQAYRWDSGRYPTPAEGRNMMYGALLRGARGIVWYAMWEGASRYLPSVAPALWNDLRLTNAELGSLAPFLLHGTRTEADPVQERVHAAHWQKDNQIVVIVLSTEREAAREVAIDLPPGTLAEATPMFPSRGEDGMAVAGGQLTGSIGPEEVHVYVIDLPLAGNDSPSAAFSIGSTPAFEEEVALDAAASSDGDGAIVSYEWDFGDGTAGTGAAVSHAWRLPGTYDVRLTVRDDDGATATSIVPVTVGVTSLCAPLPREDCEGAPSSLTIRDKGDASRRSLVYSIKRAAAAPGAMGDPATTTEYAVCLYDAGTQAMATSVRPVNGWKNLGTSGFRFAAPASTAGGLTSMRIKGSAGSVSATLKGKGAELPDPGLPLSLPVVAQLVAGDTGACWSATFQSGGATRSTPSLFRARTQ